MGEQQGRAGAVDLVMDVDPVAVEFRHFKSWRFALTMSARSCGTLLQIDPIRFRAECPRNQRRARYLPCQAATGVRRTDYGNIVVASHKLQSAELHCL